jgi:aminoglycoside phosphotransferase (APT) family kinase protein
LLNDTETATVRAVQQLVPAFAGERPVPCHRDYYPGNWIVSSAGAFAGVFDFEFSAWDVAAADFTRSATWEWIERPELLRAMEEGYGIQPSTRWQEQLIVAHAQYALSAITWGAPHAFHGYVREGRVALARLAELLK